MRYGSTRFPGKPLVQIKGRSALQRVWSLCCSVSGVDRVIIATDDERIAELAASIGALSVMTSESCRNGSERVFEAACAMEDPPQLVINVQGDAVLTPPWIIQQLAEFMQGNPACQMGTVAVRLSDQEYSRARESAAGTSGVFVTIDSCGRALYFSRALIPHWRDGQGERPATYKHVGIYAYRFETLKRYVSLEPGVLEEVEKLEQLRALENGIPVTVVISDRRGRTLCSVDRPEDARRAAEIIDREGELI